MADRSVETSKAWLRKHPDMDLVSRDRGKLFREAATLGAPQAKQVVDRFHLQKNFAEALEKFFRKQERKHEGQVRLEQWKAAVRASGIAELIAFVDGLADDAEAVANGCSMTWSNGMVEGFVNKVKWIKRRVR